MSLAKIVLQLVARIVPAERRDAWASEWRAELRHAWITAMERGESPWLVRARLTLRALESTADALWLRSRRADRSWRTGTVRDAIRGLVRHPTYSLAVIGILALGIGSSTAIFTVIDGLLVRPIPFQEPDELVVLSADPSPTTGLDPDALRVWRAEARVFTDVRAHSNRSFILTGAGEARRYRAELVEPGFLALLGLRPAQGRTFTPEDAEGDRRVALISDDVWREAFGGAANVVGRSVELDGEPHEVIGVLPPTLRLLPGGLVDLLVPLGDPDGYDRLQVMGRLRTGVPPSSAQARLDAAQARLDAVADALSRERPREEGWNVELAPLGRFHGQRPVVRRGLLALGAGVACLLLIAYANAAGLLLLRGVSRRPELGLRLALGASRGSLLRQVLLESVVLAMAAGVLGTLVAWWSVTVLVAMLPPTVVQFSFTTVSMDGRVLAFAVLLTLLTGLVFGTLPAWRAATTATGMTRRTTTGSREEVRLRAGMQVAQLALALVLLAGAGLFGRSFMRLVDTDPGFDADRVLQMELVSLERLRGEDATADLAREMDARLRSLPGVTGVSRASGMGLRFGYTVETAGGDPWESSESILPFLSVDTAYFRVMGIPLLEGRGFTPRDVDAGDAVVMDEDLARALWPEGTAVGRRFRIDTEPWHTVVGVTGDVLLAGPRQPYGPYQLFYPASQRDLRTGSVIIRTSTDPEAMAPAAREALRKLDPDQPVVDLRTGTDIVRETLADPRLLTTLMIAFACMALFLAVAGVYGLVSFAVAQRRREIGVRVALGAWKGQVMLAVVRSGLLLAVLGIAIGLLVTTVLSRLISDLLYETGSLDPGVLALAALTLLASCTLALVGPARRASNADPAEALRAE